VTRAFLKAIDLGFVDARFNLTVAVGRNAEALTLEGLDA
jgi:hypothetical protein